MKARTIPALEQTLTWRLHRLHKLTDIRSGKSYLEQVGFSMSDGRCLATIGRFAPLSVNNLAACAHLNKGQASRAAQSLVEAGLVKKAPCETDARSVVLTLTPRGTTVWRQVMGLIEQRNNEIFGCLSDAERTQLGHLLDRLIAVAQT